MRFAKVIPLRVPPPHTPPMAAEPGEPELATEAARQSGPEFAAEAAARGEAAIAAEGTPGAASELAPEAQLRKLIDAAVGGDAHAAQALLLRVLSRVRNLIRYLVRGADVDDLAQDVLLKLLERLPSYRGEGRFESWVDAVTLRVTLRSMGKRRLDRSRFSRDLLDEPPAASGPAPSQRQLASKRAVEALDHLPTPQRVALVMHHVLGMTVHEIAQEVDAPGETVRSRLRVGMRQLRERLGLTEEEP